MWCTELPDELPDVLSLIVQWSLDAEVMHGFASALCLQALETSHAIAFLDVLCPDLPGSQNVVINCSGRGDKDVQTAIRLLGM